MLGHDVKFALRGIARNLGGAAVGVGVLALGLGCFIAAYLFVGYMLSYDSAFPYADRIHVIFQKVEVAHTGLSFGPQHRTARRLAEHLATDVPELEAVARLQPSQAFVTVGGEAKPALIAFAEPAFLDIFSFTPRGGVLDGALAKPRSAVITEQAAERLLGTRDAAGTTVTVGVSGTMDVTIQAVVAEPPGASHLKRGLFSPGFDLLVSWDVAEAIARLPFDDSWGNTFVTTYVLLPRDGTLTAEALDQRMAAIAQRHVPPELELALTFSTRPVADVAATTMQTEFEGYYGDRWRIQVFDALLLFAAGIVAVACLNFINLATAQAAGRAREIGTRKALGATFAQIVRQDLARTALEVAAAIVLALAVIVPAGRLLEPTWRPALAVPWSEPRLWAGLGALLVIVTLAAGLYPALVLARARPAAALRLGTMRAGSTVRRTLLVGSQFATASFLIVAVLVAAAQGERVAEAVLGRFADQYVILNPPPPAAEPLDFDVLAAELERHPGIEGITAVQRYPLTPVSLTRPFSTRAGEQEPAVAVEDLVIGYDYFEVMDVPLLAGRAFSRERADDVSPRTPEEYRARPMAQRPVPLVLDRAAARAFGWEDPAAAIGQALYAFGQQPHEIIGVVETVPDTVRARNGTGVAYALNPRMSRTHVVRIAPQDVEASLEHIDRVMKALLPDRPPPGRVFLDEAFERVYWSFRMIARVFTGLALFAVAIAGIGLFGLASYMTARRTREIGLRKSQGASSRQVLRLLLWDFSKPVVAANLLAWPLAYVAAERYLDVFAERIALTPVPFAVALLATLAAAWLAVGGRVLRAARLRPTDALRQA